MKNYLYSSSQTTVVPFSLGSCGAISNIGFVLIVLFAAICETVPALAQLQLAPDIQEYRVATILFQSQVAVL